MDYLEQNFELGALGNDIGRFIDKTKSVSSYMEKWSHAITGTIRHMVAHK